MELRQLRYFVAVAEELHFERAARRVGIEQSPLSHQIRNLEDRLGVQLLLRTTRRTRLTPAGEVFLRDARRVLRSIELMRRSVQDAAAAGRARVRVGVTEDVAAWRLAKVLAGWRVEMPEAEFDVVDLAGQGTHLALSEGDVDVCVATYAAADDLLECTQLGREPVAVMFPACHALAGKIDVRLQDMRDERLIVGTKNPLGWAADVLALLRALKFPQDRIEHATHAASAASLAAAGRGIAVLPVMEAQVLAAAGVVVRELNEAPPVVTLFALARRNENLASVRRILNGARLPKGTVPQHPRDLNAS